MALPLALYTRTAAPTVYGVDSAEFSTAAYLLGLSHPPGAPTYLLLGHVFAWIPIGDVGYRLNLFSAVAGSVAAFLVYRIMRRLGAGATLAVTTAWLVAASYYVWTAAVAAEVYAAQACVFAGLIVLALRWREAPSRLGFCALCLLAGVGLGVHISLVLALPGLAVLLFAPPRSARCDAALLGSGALCMAVGASVFAYLPIRYGADLPLNPARDYWGVDLTTWDGFWWMLSGRGFRYHVGGVTASVLPAEVGTFAYRVWSNFLGVPALLGVAGMVVELRRRPWVTAGLLLMLIGHVGFYVTYGAPDKDTMFVPAYLLWGLWIGFGAQAAADWFASGLELGAAPALAPAALTLVVLLLVLVNYRYIDASGDDSARRRGEDILDALPRDAVFVGAWSDLRIVEYLQQVEGRRRDVGLDDTFFVSSAERARRIAAALASGRPVYVSACRDLPDATLRCERVPACGCYLLRPEAP